jgi:hypothetical protein
MRGVHGFNALLLLLVLGGSPSLAQARDPVAAEALFNEGRALSEKGDDAGACAKFEESLRLDAASGTLLNLANCEEKLGELADAWMHWQQAAAALPDGDERIAIAKERLAALEKRVPRLAIALGPDAPGGARIERDGTELRAASLDVPLPVNPGRHRIVVRAAGHADRSYEVTIAEGKQERLVVTVGPKVAGSAATAGTAVAPDPDSRSSLPGWILGGVGVAGIGVAVTTGIMLGNKRDTVEDECDKASRLCNPEGVDAAESGRTLLTINTVAWVVGVAGVASGTYFILTSGKSKTQVGASAGPTGAAISLSRRF